MPVFAAKRLSDGFLGTVTQVPNMPSNLIERAIEGYGGSSDDWEIVVLSNEQYDDLAEHWDHTLYLTDETIVFQQRFSQERAALQEEHRKPGRFLDRTRRHQASNDNRRRVL